MVQDEGPNGRENESSMGLAGKRPQMFRQLELPFKSRGEALRVERSEEEPAAARGDERSRASELMERVISRQNLQAALKRVRKNKGRPRNQAIESEANGNCARVTERGKEAGSVNRGCASSCFAAGTNRRWSNNI
jgi:hypothetical protein